MNKSEILDRTESFVKDQLCNAESGHDWWHIHRVRQAAMYIAKIEKGDMVIVELSALLHDISDAKFNGGDELAGGIKAAQFLQSVGLQDAECKTIQQIINSISYKGGTNIASIDCLELNIVQDADRLDAIGAIGIARCFSYGGFMGREMYNPEIHPQSNMTLEQYRSNTGHSINHFYEKLLKLKELMKTSTGKSLANHRHEFMELYLHEFFAEWEGTQFETDASPRK